jgi:hypothetical protein
MRAGLAFVIAKEPVRLRGGVVRAEGNGSAFSGVKGAVHRAVRDGPAVRP